MHRSKILSGLFFWILVLGITWALAQGEVEAVKKVVMIIAQENFRDEELFVPKEILEQNGIEVLIASTSLNPAKGTLGGKALVDILMRDIDMKNFAALIFVGGSGAAQYWDDQLAHKLIKDALALERVVAAICIAPVTLAKAGVLKGRRATVFSSEAAQLKANGANYTGSGVEKDGKIITASGPAAAKDFGEALVRAIIGNSLARDR